MNDTAKPSNSGMRFLFPWLAGVLVFATIGASSYHMFKMTEQGVAIWWPFPMFALMTYLILKINYAVYGSDER